MTTGRTMVDVLEQAASDHGASEAFVDGSERLTFAELHRASAGVARMLADRGVRRGDVVCIRLPSCIDFAVAYHAAIRLGAVTSSVNPRLGSHEADAIAETTEPALTVGPTSGTAVTLDELRAARDLREWPAAEVVPSDLVAIVWTSGTTGHPKGAMYDHRTLEAMAGGMGDLSRRFDRRLSSVPFAHVGFMGRIWDATSNVVCEVIVPTPWRAGDALTLIEAERVTVGQGVPTQWELMLTAPELEGLDLTSLRVVAVGGAPATPELIRRMRARFACPVLAGYASTETGTISRTSVSDPDEVAERTVGRPAAGVELELVNADGQPAALGEPGLIRCRSAATMLGYWRDPEATAAAVDPDGWVCTGDLGQLDALGNLTIVGRTKDMYIRGGYNIYPAEVESVLAEHPAISRAAVVGRSDPVLGEVGVCFVVVTGGAVTADVQDLRAWARTKMADYKAPDAIAVVDELPVNIVGKVDKLELRRRAEQMVIDRRGTGSTDVAPPGGSA